MNKVILIGRLTKDPEIKYSQAAEPVAVVRFTMAINRRFKREGDSEADFINCVAFGKTGEFINRYFKKGNMLAIIGEIRTGSYTKNDGTKVYTTDVVVNETYFCGEKVNKSNETPQNENEKGEFYTSENVDPDDLPF